MKFILLLRSVRDRGASYFQRTLKRTHNLRGSSFYPVARRRNGRRMQKIFGFCFPSSERSKCSRASRFGLGCGGVSDERSGTSSPLDFRFTARGLPEWTAETMTVRFGAPLHIFGNALRAFSLLPAIFHLHQKGNLNSFCCVAAGCASERKISSPMHRRNGTFCSLRLGRCHSFGFGSSGPSSGISSGKRLIRICLFATNAAGAVVGHSASVPVWVASCCIVQPLSAAVGISCKLPNSRDRKRDPAQKTATLRLHFISGYRRR